jgi:hypothetical protein
MNQFQKRQRLPWKSRLLLRNGKSEVVGFENQSPMISLGAAGAGPSFLRSSMAVFPPYGGPLSLGGTLI